MALPTNVPIIKILIPDLHNLTDLGVADASFYPSNFTIVEPTVEITPPGFNKVALAYAPSQMSVFNSNDLQITCTGTVDNLSVLPDGIWTVKMSVAPTISYNATVSFMRTTNIRRKFGFAVLKTDLSCCNGYMTRQQQAFLDEAWYYIECATAAGNDCNAVVAMDLYRTANKMLTDFIDNKPNYYLHPTYYLGGL